MFFVLSKTAGLLVSPINLCVTLLAVALVLRLVRRAPRLRRLLALVAGVQLYACSTDLVSNALLYPLESHASRPAKPPTDPAMIVMLTGMASPRRGDDYDLGDPADRFVETLRLAHRFPRAKILLSGGSGTLSDEGYREAELLGRLARDLGLPAERLIVERNSRNTRENAVESARIVRQLAPAGPVLLVTSAFHMRRSLGCFRKAGLDPIPWPVDFRREGFGLGAWLPASIGLRHSELALREYWGLVAYTLVGYL